jgi:hypothetical protein
MLRRSSVGWPPVGKGGRQVVNGMRPGVVRNQLQVLIEKIAGQELHIGAVVQVKPFAASPVGVAYW